MNLAPLDALTGAQFRALWDQVHALKRITDCLNAERNGFYKNPATGRLASRMEALHLAARLQPEMSALIKLLEKLK